MCIWIWLSVEAELSVDGCEVCGYGYGCVLRLYDQWMGVEYVVMDIAVCEGCMISGWM